jgi:hypothetical protein
MIGSKAMDVETKIVSDRKTSGEGPTCDCLCDTFFQFVLGIRIKTVANSQIINVEKLLDYMPSIDDNTHSMLGPLVACDRGYGKKSILFLLASKNSKVITNASQIGSEHPIVGSTVVEPYIDKIEKSNMANSQESVSELQSIYGVSDGNVESFRESIEPFMMSDNPTQLLGLELKVAQHTEKQTLYAVGYHDTLVKKVEQKLLRFFVYGFPNVDYLFNTWVCIPKGGPLPPLKQLFNRSVGRDDNNTLIVEGVLAEHVYALTCSQRTAE